jgi:spore photoproduct lyase
MFDYSRKFDSYADKTLYAKLPPAEQKFIKEISFRFKFTFQEFRQVTEASRDLQMWSEPGLRSWLRQQQQAKTFRPVRDKKDFLLRMQDHLDRLRRCEKKYPRNRYLAVPGRPARTVIRETSAKKVFGICPVASTKTICCQLQTIDAVENCIFGCSYCTIQTFYTAHPVINTNLHDQLARIRIRPDRYYHFGSGQSSDSLAFGNLGGILDDLCAFAADHPNVLLELKTKSNNIHYFLHNPVPPNVVCSWSLNPQVIIRNEEHYTATLRERLTAARKVADRGCKIAFHFHPLIYYSGWSRDYPALAENLVRRFRADEVLFLSFGSLTLIKPVIQKIRKLDIKTKILQMEMVSDPHGKWTYPDSVKIKLFSRIYQAFKPWQDRVYMYLCMEKSSIWEQTFGYVYETNDDFEQDFARKTIGTFYKLPAEQAAS